MTSRQPAQAPRPQPRAEPARSENQAAALEVRPDVKPEPRPRVESKPNPPLNTAALPPPPQRNKVDREAAIQRFAMEISRMMGKGVSDRDYPRLARDRRWQGTTHLLLHMSADGRLSEVSVATSSGYQILDTRAIELVKRFKLPAVPAEIEAQAFAVRIPVRFALRE